MDTGNIKVSKKKKRGGVFGYLPSEELKTFAIRIPAGLEDQMAKMAYELRDRYIEKNSKNFNQKQQ